MINVLQLIHSFKALLTFLANRNLMKQIKVDEDANTQKNLIISGYAYWYRQYPNKELQYLIYSGQPSSGRLRMTKSQTSTELTITGVTLSDSALYYCALRVLAQ
uniref:Ig-like domain-containing protein n=1 Tax=Cyprinus carpio TaxID=7962 RepID=A0A8C1TF46_CYPCA